MKCICSKIVNNPLYNIKNDTRICKIHKNYYKKLLCENYHLFNKSMDIIKYFDYILKEIFPNLSLESIIYIFNNELKKYINYIEVIYREYYTKIFIKNSELDYNHESWINFLKSTYSEYNFDTNFNNIKSQLLNPLKILNIHIPKKDHNISGLLFIKNIQYNIKKNDIYFLESCGILSYNLNKYNDFLDIRILKDIPLDIVSILYGKKINYKNISKALTIMYESMKILEYDKYQILQLLYPNTYNEYDISNNIIYSNDEYFNLYDLNLYYAIQILNKYNILTYIKIKYKSYDIINYLNIEVSYKNKIYKRII